MHSVASLLTDDTGVAVCPGYDKLPIRASGQPDRPKAFNERIPLRTLQAWQSM